MENKYTEDIVAIAKRENNQKRSYLVVNKLQGKHIPVAPGDAFQMFHALAKKVKEAYPDETLLLVGFAETATAIGVYLAVELDTYYIQTTREHIPGVCYLCFSESHSHATEQMIVKNDMDDVISKIDRIVFVEDEVTTGNTILHMVDLLKQTYGEQAMFAVASILNGMDSISQETYRMQGIDMLYLVKTDHSGYAERAEQFTGKGIYRKKNTSPAACHPADQPGTTCMDGMVLELEIPGCQNARRLQKGASYQKACETLWNGLWRKLPCSVDGLLLQPADGKASDRTQEMCRPGSFLQKGRRVLVLGTEEFMYPALYVAKQFEEAGCMVRFHATTRSPIAPSPESGYPLQERYELASLYDARRTTYIYELATYDVVFVITDAVCEEPDGVNSLLHALMGSGNQDIVFVKWREGERI